MNSRDILNYIKERTGENFSDYISDSTANEYFSNALLNTIEKRYTELATQRNFDDLNFLIQRGSIYTVKANKLRVKPINIVTMAGAAASITIATNVPHGLTTGDLIQLHDVTDITITPILSFPITGEIFYTVTSAAGTKLFTIEANSFSGTYVAGAGYITTNNIVADYLHVLDVKAKYTRIINDTVITGATNATPVVVTLSRKSRLRTGSQVRIASVFGNDAANGDFYVKQINAYKYALYSDALLASPVSGSGAYASGGVVSEIYYNVCAPVKEAAGVLGNATVINPQYAESDGFLKFTPDVSTCDECTINYLQKPTVPIDVEDPTVNLSNIYGDSLLYRVAEEFINLFKGDNVDSESLNISNQQLVKNP